jgi:hypothetical protein
MAAGDHGRSSKRHLDLDVRLVDGSAFRIFANNMPIVRVSDESKLAPALEGMLVGYAVRSREDCAVFHAASIAIQGRAILLCGGKGSGKSTLSLALSMAGAKYLGDELAFVRFEDRRIEAFPKAVTLKSGSFALFGEQATHDDPVRGPIRYVRPKDTALIGEPFSPELLVFPRYDARVRDIWVTDLRSHEVAFELVRQCFGGLGRDPRTMELVAKLSSVRALGLRYSDHCGAARAIFGLLG